jgi:hypothetical protein
MLASLNGTRCGAGMSGEYMKDLCEHWSSQGCMRPSGCVFWTDEANEQAAAELEESQ